MPFPIDFLERLKAANPIAEVMNEYVSTKRSGRDYVCLCPFHNEKTASCYIHPDEGYFHCFGCNAGGDVITFTMKYHNLEYSDAVKLLAERANIEMPIESYSPLAASGMQTRKRMYAMNKDAARFFYKQLSSEEGRACVRYLRGVRGLSVETIKRYGMGYAPNSWSTLKNHMTGLGYSEKELEQGGLISRSKNNTKKTFDFFVNRAMFPFIDLTGNIVGFGGRTIGDDKRKYVNTKDTPVYNKNKFLFSMNIAKNAAVKSGKILLCEGNLDVITLVQAGFENAVASCGTALTPEQAKLISNYAKEVVICYDSDEAGQKASARAVEILDQAGLKITVAQFSGAKDPDEYIKSFGAAAFGVVIDEAVDAVNYELNKAKAKVNMETSAGKTAYKDEAVKIAADIDSPVERELYCRQIAKELDVSFASFDEEVKSTLRKRANFRRKKQTQDMLSFADKRDPVNTQARQYHSEANFEEIIISYLYNNHDFYETAVKSLPPASFVTEFNRKVYEYILNALENEGDCSISAMNEAFSPDEMGAITRIVGRAKAESFNEKVALGSIERLTSFAPKQDAGNMSNEDFVKYTENLKHKKNG